jgi:hypothetical protein
MGRKGSGLIWNLELQGGSPCLCRLSPASVGSEWTSIWNVLTHIGHMESLILVASCVAGMEAILPYLTGVQWDSEWAIHRVSAEAYAWKTCTRVRWALNVSLVTSWIVATRGALLAYVCRVVRFIPLQGWLLIQISVTPSDMGDGLFTASKRRIINFIIPALEARSVESSRSSQHLDHRCGTPWAQHSYAATHGHAFLPPASSTASR